MCQAVVVSAAAATHRLSDEKRRVIHDAAIDRFSVNGFAATSMADIADAAGMSRPALYQYFRNKEDIFASAFIHLFDVQVERALAGLDEPGTTAEQLDAFLQRFDGDLWERTSASAHSDEILEAKNAEIVASVDRVVTRLWDGMAAYLNRAAPGRSRAAAERRAGWIEVLKFSPKGLKFDQPAVDVYRRRLAALAASVAADIDAS
jgi:TetR/AcrR family transcriptional regulator